MSRELRNTLPQYIKQEHLAPDELIFTGDYRHALYQKNRPVESIIDEVVELIQAIAAASGINDMRHVHIIPGNHDRDRSQDFRYISKIRKNYSSTNGIFEQDDLRFLNSQFGFFVALSQKLFSGNDYWANFPLHTYRKLNDIVLIYLNTTLMHNFDTDRYHLLIGNNDLSIILEKIRSDCPDLPIAILAHHSPEFFEKEEREAFEVIIREHPVELYLCGDAHSVFWRKTNKCLEITMGCLKSDFGIQAAFSYGDTQTRIFKAYKWDGRFGSNFGWGAYSQFNESINEHLQDKTPKQILTTRLIQNDQARLLNDTLLPWMKHSVSYRTVLPKLFIYPDLMSCKVKRAISLPQLRIEYRSKNIVIIGDAGSGKSTLLKYLYLSENPDNEFLYLKATALKMDSVNLSLYERGVIDIIHRKVNSKKHRIILLDAMDEAYSETPFDIDKLLAGIMDKSDNISIWFGWRTEYYNQQETEKLRLFLDDVIALQKWSIDSSLNYISVYANQTRQPSLNDTFKSILENNQVFKAYIETPLQLNLLIYILENEGISTEFIIYFNSANPSIFGLYYIFFMCWLKKEQYRKTSHLNNDEVMFELQRIAQALYYGGRYRITNNDSAITDLLKFSSISNKDEKIATEFFHRNFCSFFYASRIYDSMKKGGKPLIESLNQPLRNDITDFVRSAVSMANNDFESDSIIKNLINIYEQIMYPNAKILSADSRKYISGLSNESVTYLKNELIYFVTRIHGATSSVSAFLINAYQSEQDPFLRLDLAYGAALTGPSWITLEYANLLVPGSTEDLTNRSWTVVYFGDVYANPYQFKDNITNSWDKARKVRLKRFQSSSFKAVRFRILDIPLLYCFYVSRGWQDICQEDFQIILDIQIDNSCYSPDESAFLKKQKLKLVSEYRNHLEMEDPFLE